MPHILSNGVLEHLDVHFFLVADAVADRPFHIVAAYGIPEIRPHDCLAEYIKLLPCLIDAHAFLAEMGGIVARRDGDADLKRFALREPVQGKRSLMR